MHGFLASLLSSPYLEQEFWSGLMTQRIGKDEKLHSGDAVNNGLTSLLPPRITFLGGAVCTDVG